jgi:hypothetical protein
MPRKLLPPIRVAPFLSNDPLETEVEALIAQFEHLAGLDPASKTTFHRKLLWAVQFARIGAPVRRSDYNGKKLTLEYFASEVASAMRSVEVPVRSWRRDTIGRDPNNGEALYYRVLRAAAALADLKVPADAFRLKKRAEKVVVATVRHRRRGPINHERRKWERHKRRVPARHGRRSF